MNKGQRHVNKNKSHVFVYVTKLISKYTYTHSDLGDKNIFQDVSKILINILSFKWMFLHKLRTWCYLFILEGSFGEKESHHRDEKYVVKWHKIHFGYLAPVFKWTQTTEKELLIVNTSLRLIVYRDKMTHHIESCLPNVFLIFNNVKFERKFSS